MLLKFKAVLLLNPIWGNHPIWLICCKYVEPHGPQEIVGFTHHFAFKKGKYPFWHAPWDGKYLPTPVNQHSIGRSTNWRCISYWKRWISVARLVYWRVHFKRTCGHVWHLGNVFLTIWILGSQQSIHTIWSFLLATSHGSLAIKGSQKREVRFISEES